MYDVYLFNYYIYSFCKYIFIKLWGFFYRELDGLLNCLLNLFCILNMICLVINYYYFEKKKIF